ncbi:MAG: serine/threonine protein kinase, partial [Oscillospiraceae bacterium]|nr:serine/threonine protein kinase [Oscillospiraceae bacterium]
LCKNCFSEKKGRSCPVCGYSGSSGNNTGSALKRGTRLNGRYTVGGVIGSGGFGITYMAYDMKNNTLAAVKEYFPRLIAIRTVNDSICPSSAKHADIYSRGTEEFYREAEYVFQFNGNPNIMSVSDYFYENNTAYVVMEYLHGVTLENYIKKHGALSDEQTVYIAEKILMALISVHSAQLLHRDISPDNIMLCADGKVKLIDFGAARMFTAEGLNDFTIITKKGFTPAEQYMYGGNFGEWTDLYSFGAVLYYAAAGKIPEDPYKRMINGDELDFGDRQTDPALKKIIGKAVSISAAKRYKTASEMKKAFSELKIKGSPISFPDDCDPFKAKSFSATVSAGYAEKTGLKWQSVCAAAVLTVSAFAAGAFFNGGTAASVPVSVPKTDPLQTAEAKPAVETMSVEEILSAAKKEDAVFTRDGDTVKIEFDGEFGENYEYCGAIPASLLKSFDGDVKITLDLDKSDEFTGFIPTDGSGKCVIEYLSTEMYPWAEENGWILVGSNDWQYDLTISREGIEKLQGDSLGFETYGLAVKSVTLEKGEKIGGYHFRDYSEVYAPIVKSTKGDGSKVITADIAGNYAVYGDGDFNMATVPKSAFLEFDGDVLMTVEVEHLDNEDSHPFRICTYSAAWDALDGMLMLTEIVDYKNEEVLLRYSGGEYGYWIDVNSRLSECSVTVPREAVERISGGVFFQPMGNIKIKNVRLESAYKEAEHGNMSN